MLSEVPERWDQVRIDEVLQRNTTSISVTELAAEGLVAHYSLPAFDANKQPVIESGSEIKSNKTAIDKDCLLFSKLNPRIPRVWRVRHTGEQKPVSSTEFWALKPKTGEVSLSYAEYFLGWDGFLSHPSIKPASSTNSHQRVDRKAFDAFMLPIPPLNEQHRIAEILASLDASIQATQAVIEQAERLKRGLMEELLTGGLGSEAIALGEVPEGYEAKKLGDLLAGIDGGVSVNSQSEPASYEQKGILKTSCVSNSFFDASENKVVPDEKEIQRLREPVQAETIIFSRMNTPKLVGANAYVPVSHKNLFLPDRLWALKPVSKVKPRWLGFYMGYLFSTGAFEALGTGTSGSMKNISKSKLKEVSIAVPPEVEQARIAEILSSIDELIAAQKSVLEQQLHVKRGLMDDLLTGKVRTV
jgi:hypothetical protein